jgi:hypothetical protein
MNEPSIIESRATPPRPRLRLWLLLWWAPAILATLIAAILSMSNGGVAEMPKDTYRHFESLTAFAFWWLAGAVLVRVLLRTYRDDKAADG